MWETIQWTLSLIGKEMVDTVIRYIPCLAYRPVFHCVPGTPQCQLTPATPCNADKWTLAVEQEVSCNTHNIGMSGCGHAYCLGVGKMRTIYALCCKFVRPRMSYSGTTRIELFVSLHWVATLISDTQWAATGLQCMWHPVLNLWWSPCSSIALIGTGLCLCCLYAWELPVLLYFHILLVWPALTRINTNTLTPLCCQKTSCEYCKILLAFADQMYYSFYCNTRKSKKCNCSMLWNIVIASILKSCDMIIDVLSQCKSVDNIELLPNPTYKKSDWL